MRIILVIITLLAAGCAAPEDIAQSRDITKLRWEANKKAVDACLERGGIPVWDNWTSYTIVDCKAPQR